MENLGKIPATAKNGEESLFSKKGKINYTLLDFWRWSGSDLLSNTTRGKFAEFIVGTTINLNPKQPRVEWDDFDLITEESIRIEVKSAAYVQSWNQHKYSSISFSIKPSVPWDEKLNKRVGEPRRQADLYVFCLLKHQDQPTIDPLNLEQWEFYVLPTFVLDRDKKNSRTISLKSLKSYLLPTTYADLREAISQAYQQQKERHL
jgi:hypothetical protein